MRYIILFIIKNDAGRQCLVANFSRNHDKTVMAAGEVRKEIKPPVFHTYPVCKTSDMPEDMKQEALEMCVTATEKFSDNYKHAAKMIKDDLDKKFGPPFQVIVGESYGFSVIYQKNTMMHMYTGGNVAILIFRTVAGFNS